MGKLYERGAEWRRWDLQVQTILDDGYVELRSYAEQLKTSRPKEWVSFVQKVGSEELALKYDSKAYFNTDPVHSEKIRAENYARNFVAFLTSFHKDEICIAVTDHNYHHPHLLDALLDSSKDTSLAIICGVEINVQGVHMLILFGEKIYGKDRFSEGIRTFLSKLDIDHRKSNGVLTVCSKSYTDVLGLVKENNGIVIYPHCNSSNGLFQERGKTDRTHLADQFNFQDFNILQGKSKSIGMTLDSCIRSKLLNLKSDFCYTTSRDSRCLNDILAPDEDGNFTWIKADPTFEGLKQIMYEPSRVAIQGDIPEDKARYQVIDRIIIHNDYILNSELKLNTNMSAIIGGRSTGKSVLLAAIAKRLKTEAPIYFDRKPEYEAFVNSISNSMTVVWRDGEVNNDREIEFFQQGYMYELATNKPMLDELIQNILNLKGKQIFLEEYSSKKLQIKGSIQACVNDIFLISDEIKRRTSLILDKGDEKGVREEISRLEGKLKELDGLQLSEGDRHLYEEHKRNLDVAGRAIDSYSREKSVVNRVIGASLFKESIEYEIATLSEFSRNKITDLYSQVKREAIEKWNSGLSGLMKHIEELEAIERRKIEAAQENPSYIKADQAYKSSSQLKEVQDRIKEQKIKLGEIELLQKEVIEFQSQKAALIGKVMNHHNEYYLLTQALLLALSYSKDGLEIQAKIEFHEGRYREIMSAALNLQNSINRGFVEYIPTNNDDYKKGLERLLGFLVDKKVPLKGGYTEVSLANILIGECFYGVTYDLVYEMDNFKLMSDGKKAFVVLKLLLDFSEKKCPILIDQPEDDLDNRAIYLDLVQYLKKKKVLRQIVVATHNANIVVGADTEMVVVANQHGVKNENTDAKKFAYKSGSLEHSSRFDENNRVVLDSQGIRQHVCMILEGGDVAFKLREKKYSIM